MHCYNCGKQIEEYALYCEFCGIEQKAEIYEIDNNHERVKFKKSKRKIIYFVSIVSFLLGSSFVIFRVLEKRNNQLAYEQRVRDGFYNKHNESNLRNSSINSSYNSAPKNIKGTNSGGPDVQEMLNNEVKRSSKNFLELSNWETINSDETEFAGETYYTYEGTAVVKVMKNMYKYGNGIEGYWRTWKCHEEPIGKGSILKYSHNSEFYSFGTRVRIKKKLNFRKFDQGWKLSGSENDMSY